MSGLFKNYPAARKMLLKAQSDRQNGDHKNDGHENDSEEELQEALLDMVRPIVEKMQWVFQEYPPEEQEVVLYIIGLYCVSQRRRLLKEALRRVPRQANRRRKRH